jgi:DNA-binding LytR/AlgR family response regulator
MDYKLVGKMDGIEIAIEILKKYPTRFIIFITGFEFLEQEILKHDIFFQKKIDVLIKPVKLRQIENSILNVMQHL